MPCLGYFLRAADGTVLGYVCTGGVYAMLGLRLDALKYAVFGLLLTAVSMPSLGYICSADCTLSSLPYEWSCTALAERCGYAILGYDPSRSLLSYEKLLLHGVLLLLLWPCTLEDAHMPFLAYVFAAYGFSWLRYVA